MLAKRFFYVCAGLFLLALTYHLGATSALSQSQSVVASASASAAILRGGALYTGSYGAGRPVFAGPFSLPKPGVVAAVGYGSGYGSVVYEDGDYYFQGANNDVPYWIYVGNLFGAAPTATTGTTWGRVKADYRK